MNAYYLQRLLLKLEAHGYLDYAACFDDFAPVRKLDFMLDDDHFQVKSVFLNDLYCPEKAEEELDIHFTFDAGEIHGELLWVDREQCWAVQSIDTRIQDHFAHLSFAQAGNNHYASIDSTPVFYLENQSVSLDAIKLAQDNTPDDYSDTLHLVYFAIGGKKQNKINKAQIINALPDFVDADAVLEKPYGFSLKLTTQQIPDVVSALVRQEMAVYQVCYNKTSQ